MVNFLACVGNTPMVRLPSDDGAADILGKAELFNPSGSVKDRLAKFAVEAAERRGELVPGNVIVEVTSGNTGISLAMVAAAKGYALKILMPEQMSVERRIIMEALGAEVILTPEKEGFVGAIDRSREMAAKDDAVWLPRQFENIDNVHAHRMFTGAEVISQTHGRVNAFVAGVGTGGTVMGVARALRDASMPAAIVAVEPAEAAVLSGGTPGRHKIQGLGDGFVPNLIDRDLVNRVEAVSSEDAMRGAQELTSALGVLVGISSGANYVAARRVARDLGRGQTVVTVLPDRGERYFSTELYCRSYCAAKPH